MSEPDERSTDINATTDVDGEQPAAPDSPISDLQQDIIVTVIEADGEEHFQLLNVKTSWTEGGQQHTTDELRLRCLFCNFGYNGYPFTRVRDLVNIGQFAKEHSGTGGAGPDNESRCRRSGRTVPLESPDTHRTGRFNREDWLRQDVPGAELRDRILGPERE